MANILLIEDDKLLLKVYRNILQVEGHKVTCAEDGELGLSYILEGGFDLILLDMIMPKKAGLEVLKELQKKKPVSPNGPIVVLSNLGEEKTMKRALKLGAVAYILKDKLEPNFLAKEVDSYLKQKNLY